jgi:hypothetical protein
MGSRESGTEVGCKEWETTFVLPRLPTPHSRLPVHTCFFCSLMTTASRKLGDVPPTVPT